MFESWLLDNEEKHKFTKDYATYLGAFSNYAMAKDIWGKDSHTFESSEEDFERSTQMMLEQREQKLPKKIRRKRKLINKGSQDGQ